MNTRNRSQIYRGSGYRRSNRRSPIVGILTVVAVFALVGWLLWRLISSLFGGGAAQALGLTLDIYKGRAEFNLAETDPTSWTDAYQDLVFFTGDTVKTRANSRASLTVIGGTTVFLDEETELKLGDVYTNTDNEPTMKLELLSGRVWANVSDEFLQNKEPMFSVETPRVLVTGADGIVDVLATPETTEVRVLKGEMTAEVFFDDEQKESRTVQVGVGQSAAFALTDLPDIQNEKNVLDSVEIAFEESNWNLENLVVFDPQKAEELRRSLELKAPQAPTTTGPTTTSTTTSTTSTTPSKLSPPSITSPKNGSTVPANETNELVVTGRAPVGAEKIQVKTDSLSAFYTLQKFEPGSTEWRYIISSEFKSLKGGSNTIRVVALDASGNASAEASSTFTYEGVTGDVISADTPPATTPTTTSENSSIPDAFTLKAPTITNPPSTPYTTAAEVVTIIGTVDRGTNAIEINGFRLREFKAGDRQFKYVANANYDNMQEGLNTYSVMAFGPGEEKAETVIEIMYKPLKLDTEPTTAEPVGTGDNPLDEAYSDEAVEADAVDA